MKRCRGLSIIQLTGIRKGYNWQIIPLLARLGAPGALHHVMIRGAVLRMEMRRVVIVKEHFDDDTKKAADFRHK